MFDSTILLADDQPLFLSGLKSVVQTLFPLGKILETRNGLEVIGFDLRNSIDLIILGHRMADISGFETARMILKRNPPARILMVCSHLNDSLSATLFQLGIKGAVTKSSNENTFHSAISTVMSGHFFFENETLIIPTRRTPINRLALRFTPRENELITLLAKGLTSQQIARRLGLTCKTIETYRCRLLDKVGVRNTSELLHYFHTHGLVKEDSKSTFELTSH